MSDQHRDPAVPAVGEDGQFALGVLSVADTGLDAAGEPVFDRIADLVRTLLGVPVALVSLLDDRREFFPGAAGLGEPWAAVRQIPLSHAICQLVAVTQGPLVITDARTDARCRGRQVIMELSIAGYAGMPLTDADGTVLGALCAIDHEPRTWTETELSMLADMAMASSDSLRLRIATRHAEHGRAVAGASSRRAQAASQRSDLLLRASELLAETRTVAQIVAAVAQLTSPAFAPSHTGMVLLDREQRLQVGTQSLPDDVAARWPGFSVSAPLSAAEAFRSGQLLSMPDPAAIRAGCPQLAGEMAALGWQAIACAPVPGVHGRLGVLTFAWDRPHQVDVAQRSIMVTIAGYVGQALQRVTLLQEQNTAARTLQQALLTRLPHAASARLAARYLPAHHGDLVGSDWYDAVALPDGRLALVIGDVSGHNLTAAACMSELRSMLRGMLIDRAETPSAVLERLDHVNHTLGGDTIATVLLAYLEHEDDGSHALSWSNAGHPPPSVLTADGHITTLTGTDPLLGAQHRRPRHTYHHWLAPGASLLLHTDGLVESRTATIDDGYTALHQLLTGRAHADPDTLADLLVAYADTRTREDDVALIIATTAPADAPARWPSPQDSGISA